MHNNKLSNRIPRGLNRSPALRFASAAFVLLLTFYADNVVVGQDLLTPAADAPQYRLSNPRHESDMFGRRIFVADYTRTEEGKLDPSPAIYVSGKTKSGKLTVSGAPISKTGGQLRLSVNFGSSKDIEIYFVVRGAYGTMLVSNVLRQGDPGAATQTKAWTAEETAAYERAKLATTPPKSLPEGYIAVKPGAELLPGMPIQAGSYAEWVKATVIRADANERVLVQLAGKDKLVFRDRAKWLAIKAETLQQGANNPSQFRTDIRALPNSRLIIPDGADPLPKDLELPVGTPLKYDYGSRWRDVYVVRNVDDEIKLRYKDFDSKWDTTQPRSKFLITKEILDQLKQPEVAKKFASNIAPEKFPGKDSAPFSGRKIRIKSYPIKLEIPEKSQIVPEDVTLEPGTPLAACWANKWNALSVMHENDDGSVKIRFEGWKTEYNMKRSELVIQDKTLSELRSKQPLAESKANAEEEPASERENVTAEQLTKTLRVWTDSTGEFKIEAYYVSHTMKKITLLTAADREINMPFSKLSEADQDLISKLDQKSRNPFQ